MKIIRFDPGARVLHWSHAILFLWLLLTGIHMFLTPKSLLGDPLIKMLHLYASIPFILIPGALYLFSHSIYMRNDIRELMSFKSYEMKWFFEFLKNTRVNTKFNPGQKVNFFVTLLLIIGLFLSGSVVWMKSLFSVDFVELNFMVHDFLAEISLLLISGHILLSLYHSESIRGIVYGKVEV
ncbi:MAG: cytochrome b/b6 domain-containing protein [Candidatus Methanoperedens sp.]|nr:cytochrome b/b6 domain-containing protein [Candidatus Methanoperedens sp.]